jgi:hypothetical protein
MEEEMRKLIKPIAISLLVISMAGCSLLPSLGQTPTPSPNPSIPPSGYEPQPGDEKLTRGPVFLELENSSLAIMESYPIQVSAILNGNLPDPCHQLRVVVAPALTEKRINLEVYSLTDSTKVCITVLEPFNATIGLGSFPTGHYSVYVNGELLGEFDA